MIYIIRYLITFYKKMIDNLHELLLNIIFLTIILLNLFLTCYYILLINMNSYDKKSIVSHQDGAQPDIQLSIESILDPLQQILMVNRNPYHDPSEWANCSYSPNGCSVHGTENEWMCRKWKSHIMDATPCAVHQSMCPFPLPAEFNQSIPSYQLGSVSSNKLYSKRKQAIGLLKNTSNQKSSFKLDTDFIDNQSLDN